MITIYLYEVPINNFEEKNITKAENKRLTSLFAKKIVKDIASKMLKVGSDDIFIDRNESGKPFLRDYPNFNFNISHCQNTVAVAFSSTPIGIDIEKIRTLNLKVIDRYFSNFEKAYINKSVDSNRAFFKIWTAKESYLKYKGTGIKDNLSKISVINSEISKKIKTIENNGFIISVCCDSIEEIDIEYYKNNNNM